MTTTMQCLKSACTYLIAFDVVDDRREGATVRKDDTLRSAQTHKLRVYTERASVG